MNIEKLKENIENIDADNISSEDISSIRQTIDALDNGKISVFPTPGSSTKAFKVYYINNPLYYSNTMLYYSNNKLYYINNALY